MGRKVSIAVLWLISAWTVSSLKTLNVRDNESAANAPRLYRNAKGVYASAYASVAPYGAFSFHVPTTVPAAQPSKVIPVKQESVVIQNSNGFLKDSYGNKFVETPTSVAYKTTFPQQFVQLQHLPAHLSQPLTAAPTYHFPQSFLAAAAPLTRYGAFASPFGYAGNVKSLTPASDHQFQFVTPKSAQQDSSNNKVVYATQGYSQLQSEPKFQRLEEKPYEGEYYEAPQQLVAPSLEAKVRTPITHTVKTTHNGKDTVVQIETKPPLPLLDLSLLEPLTFANPVVPQVQHYLPKINALTMSALHPYDAEEKNEKEFVIHKTKSYDSGVVKGKAHSDNSKKKNKKPPKKDADVYINFESISEKPSIKVKGKPNDPGYSYEITSPGHKESFNQQVISYNKETQSDPVTYTYEKQTQKEPVTYSFSHNSNNPGQTKSVQYVTKDPTPAMHLVYNFQPEEAAEHRESPKPSPEESDDANASSEADDEGPGYDHAQYDGQSYQKQPSHSEHSSYSQQPSHRDQPHSSHSDHPHSFHSTHSHSPHGDHPHSSRSSHSHSSHGDHPPSGHNGHPHSSKSGHSHSSHSDHPHSSHGNHPHSAHNGHPHSSKNAHSHSSHSDHTHSSHGDHPHSAHNGHPHSSKSGHSHSAHSDHPHSSHSGHPHSSHSEHSHSSHSDNPHPSSHSHQSTHPPSSHSHSTASYPSTTSYHPKSQNHRVEHKGPSIPQSTPSYYVVSSKPQYYTHAALTATPKLPTLHEYMDNIRFIPSYPSPFTSAALQVAPSRQPLTPQVKPTQYYIQQTTPRARSEGYVETKPVIYEKSQKIIIQEESPDEVHSHQEKVTAQKQTTGQNENSEEDFEKSYKEAAYGFPAYDRDTAENEDDIFKHNYGEPPSENSGEESDHTPFEQYTKEGDAFPKSSRLTYKDDRDKVQEDYFTGYSLHKPESMTDFYQSKLNYYKMFMKNKPEKLRISDAKQKASKLSKYTVEPSFYDSAPRQKQKQSAQYKPAPVFEYNYDKEAPRDSSAYASRPFHSRTKTHFVEPQFQYGFEPLAIPRLDIEQETMATNLSPESDKPGTRKKIHKEKFYIKKVTTSSKPS